MSASSSRYPYTHAADFIRSARVMQDWVDEMSRAEASMIRHRISEALGLDDEYVAKKLADAYLRQTGQG